MSRGRATTSGSRRWPTTWSPSRRARSTGCGTCSDTERDAWLNSPGQRLTELGWSAPCMTWRQKARVAGLGDEPQRLAAAVAGRAHHREDRVDAVLLGGSVLLGDRPAPFHAARPGGAGTAGRLLRGTGRRHAAGLEERALDPFGESAQVVGRRRRPRPYVLQGHAAFGRHRERVHSVIVQIRCEHAGSVLSPSFWFHVRPAFADGDPVS